MEELQRIRIPNWAVKPQHRQTVIATNKGWVVQSTGEVLKRVNDLPRKLEMLKQHINEVMVETFAPITIELPENISIELVLDVNSNKRGVSEDVAKAFAELLHSPDEKDSSQESVINTDNEVSNQSTPKKRGRKPGSKKKVESDATETHEETNS